MRHLLKIHVLFVAAAVAFGTLTANAIMPHHDSAPVQEAGCHSHHKTPDAPVTYQCCQNGHDSALVQSAESGRQPLMLVSITPISSVPALIQNPVSCSTTTARDSGEPPGISPLRI